MRPLESVLLLVVVAGLFALVIGVVTWAGNRGAPGAKAPPPPVRAVEAAPAGAAAPAGEAAPGVDVSKGLRRADRQDDLDALLEQVDAAEAREAAAQP